MATLSTGAMTLLDHAKIHDKDGKVAVTAELLSQTNEILDDMLWKQGNLPTGERVTVRTGLPTSYWRKVNAGVPASKSTSAQIDVSCGILEAWSEIDQEIADLGGNTNGVRFNEARAHIEGMSQEFASTLFYGDATAPEEFVGFASQYNDLSANNAQNIISAGGTGSDNSSIWLVGWGDNTCYGVFPQGSMAGLQQEDFGLQTIETTSGVGGSRMRAYQERFCMKGGLVVKDWRYAVRIANIDISVLTADNDGSTTNIIEYMLRAIHRLPTTNNVRPCFYVNRTVGEMLDIQAQNKSNLQLNVGNEEGKRKLTLRGIPIKTVDALTETEAQVS